MKLIQGINKKYFTVRNFRGFAVFSKNCEIKFREIPSYFCELEK